MGMFLHWINVTVSNVYDLLWYLVASPPPSTSHWVEIAKEKLPSQPNDDSSPSLSTPGPAEETLSSQPNDDSSQPLSTPQAADSPAKGTQVQSRPEPIPIVQPTPRLFALVIGIDEYANLRNLTGAVADADAVNNFLLKNLNVPENQIRNLRNKDVTRVTIEEEIKSLGDNPAIKPGDAILIFYAGHGAEGKAPAKRPSADGKIQMLAPHDFLKGGSDDLKRGQGFPNVRLSHLLQDIANKKSDNITVILDCCHSGSGTRTDDDDETFSVRGIDLPASYTIPDDLLPDIKPDIRESGIAEGYKNAGLLSHVLLSACQAGERAREDGQRGVFTSALLEVLQEHAVNKLTYTDVITNLRDLPAQNPQCEGVHRSRCLFNSKVASPHREIHPICAVQPGDLDMTPGQYILEAGEAYGITKNAEFVVFADKTKALESAWESALGTVVAVKTTAFKTTCDFSPRGDKTQPFLLPAPGFALQTRVGEGQDVRLFIDLAPELIPVFMRIAEEMQSSKEGKRGFSLVKSRDDTPNLVVTVDGDHVHFEIMEDRSREHGLRHMPFEVKINDAEAIHRVLQSSADFYWHLHRSSQKSPLAKKVGLECMKLTETDDYTDDLEVVLMPDPSGDNLNVGGVIRVDVDEKAKYGFRITNTSAVPLYVSMFYFDISDLSISSYYQPGYAKKEVDVSLPPHESLTIGYGASGTVPHIYTLREGQDVDVGFLKLFFSKKYMDLSGIVQKSPFDEGRASEEEKARTMEDLWHTMCVPVVQTRGGRLVI